MSRVARRTVRHAYEDFGIEPRAGLLARLRRRWLRDLFGESRATTLVLVGILVVLGLLVVRPMIMSLLSYHRTAGLLDERRTEVAHLTKRNGQLEQQVAYFRTDVFLAERARLYGLVKPGEQAFVIREYTHTEAAGRFVRSRAQSGLAFAG